MHFSGQDYKFTKEKDQVANYESADQQNYLFFSHEPYPNPQETAVDLKTDCEEKADSLFCHIERCAEEDYIAESRFYNLSGAYTVLKRMTPQGGVAYLSFHSGEQDAPSEETRWELCQLPL